MLRQLRHIQVQRLPLNISITGRFAPVSTSRKSHAAQRYNSVIAAAGATTAKKPSSDTGRQISDFAIIKELGKHIWPENNLEIRNRVKLSLWLLIGAKVLNVNVPVVFKLAVDQLSSVAVLSPEHQVAIAPMFLLVLYGVVRASSSLCSELRNAVFAKVAQRAIRDISNRVFSHLHTLDLSFHLNRQTGALSRAIERGTRGINFLSSSVVFNVVPTIFEIALTCAILSVQFGTNYAAVTLGTLAAYTAFTFVTTAWRTNFRKTMNQAETEASTKVVDSLINYETVKYFNNEAHEAKRYDESQAKHESSAVKVATSLALLNFGQNLIFSSALATTMVMASHGILEGTMSLGDLVMVNGLLFQLSLPLNFLGTVYREIRQSLIDMQAMFSLFNEKSSIQDALDAVPLVPASRAGGASVEFEDVSFAYTPDRPILDHVSFSVPPGKTVAIVGASGSGKSTITRLVYRLYDPQSGSVRINGNDVRRLTLDSLRRAIAVIPQDTVLFNDTIFYNIAYGRLGASHEEVIEAAKLAHIHEQILSFPKQYDTHVGERGLKLSGGEKQRVAIARALLKDASLLICDEATSSMDSNTEKLILPALDTIASSRSAIFIAHRLSTVVHADEIIVLDKGRIAERGSHTDLIADPLTRYAQLWARQQATTTDQSGAAA